LLLIPRIRRKKKRYTYRIKIKELINHEDLLDLDYSAVALIEGH